MVLNLLLQARARLVGLPARHASGDSESIDLEANPPLDTTNWPKAEQPQPQPGSRSVLLCANNILIDIKIGKSKKARRWLIHEGLICHYSEQFQNAVQTLAIRQGGTGAFDLSDVDASVFALFVDWLYNEEMKDSPSFNINADKYCDSYSWRTQCGKAWILADYLQAPVFARYALGKVIQNANWISRHSMEHEFQETVPNSPLHHFAAQWVAWRATHEQSVEWWWKGSQRSHDLRANMRMRGQTHVPLRGRIVTDPRRFEVEHWYSPCAANLTSPNPQPCRHGLVPVIPRPRSPPGTHVRQKTDLEWDAKVKLYTGNERFDRFLTYFAYKRVWVLIVLVLGLGVLFPSIYATRGSWQSKPKPVEDDEDDGCTVM